MSLLVGNGRRRGPVRTRANTHAYWRWMTTRRPSGWRGMLCPKGYSPIVIADPEEALRLMETHWPQLVLLGLVFPGTDGVELMQDIPDIVEVPVAAFPNHLLQKIGDLVHSNFAKTKAFRGEFRG